MKFQTTSQQYIPGISAIFKGKLMNVLRLLASCCVLLMLPLIGFAQTEFEIKPSQGMLMTGKGPGQDGTINPYAGEDCYASIENLGTSELSVHIQKKGEIITSFTILCGNSFTFKLLKDQELYLDGNDTEMAKARVSYKRVDL